MIRCKGSSFLCDKPFNTSNIIQHMSQLIYIDANVYMDYLLNRKDRLRPLGDFAFELLRKAVQCQYNILISDVVLDELKNNIPKETILPLLDMINKKLVFIEKEKLDEIKAEEISSENFWDALHYILAKKGGAEILVTRNIKHFPFSGLQIKFPENL